VSESSQADHAPTPALTTPALTTGAACERAPLGLLAELTHRCPLQCPYCSNPLTLEGAGGELTTAEWQDVLRQAARLGVLQLHLSGGEPTVRRDLEDIVATAADAGLYTNLITAGVLLSRARLSELAARGLEHVQISIQDVEPANADRIAHYQGAHAKKRQLAGWVRELGLALTVNAPVHRQNLDRLAEIVDFAADMGAGRLEVAHIQYYGWALRNRAALMPTRAQVKRSMEIVEAARERLKGILVIDFVVPDYYATWPKPCMGGWGRGIVNVTPSGRVLPCHAAETIPGLVFDNVREKPLADIWLNGQAFQKYRGTDWMMEPCRSCERREIDWGGCRCQAFAMAGEARAADPACAKSERHMELVALAEREAAGPPPAFAYRRPLKPAALAAAETS
jgi:pyrroloquinoline quinone biosynthesis protein E